jgi:hypothetical protein
MIEGTEFALSYVMLSLECHDIDAEPATEIGRT